MEVVRSFRMFKIVQNTYVHQLCRAMTSTSGSKAPPKSNRKSPQDKKGGTVSKPAAAKKAETEAYCVPEYYSYNSWSFYEIDNQMQKYRLPQPSKFTA